MGKINVSSPFCHEIFYKKLYKFLHHSVSSKLFLLYIVWKKNFTQKILYKEFCNNIEKTWEKKKQLPKLQLFSPELPLEVSVRICIPQTCWITTSSWRMEFRDALDTVKCLSDLVYCIHVSNHGRFSVNVLKYEHSFLQIIDVGEQFVVI